MQRELLLTMKRYNTMADKPDLNQLMEMAQKMQKGMQDIQQNLIDKELIGESGAGMVRVALNGQYDCKSVEISGMRI